MVNKKVFDNGFCVLHKHMPRIPSVSIQLWYGVGSKHEKTGEYGIAHFIEHMIFKGTKKLSESDINVLTTKMSGSCNAFTSYDYTGYLFDVPSQYLGDVLPLMADCMGNCTFNDEFLASELKTVVQELKMYTDNYVSSLIKQMMSGIFFDHPYRNPVLGYKQDLFAFNREKLCDFYQRHYAPNNATLIVVGDVDFDIVIKQAEQNFASIPARQIDKQDSFAHAYDFVSRSTIFERAVTQHKCVLAWVIPGVSKKQSYLVDVLTWVLASGNGSILYRLLATELDLVFDISATSYDLFEYGVFFIYFEPKNPDDIEKIHTLIFEQIEKIIQEGVQQIDLERAQRKVHASHVALYEEPEEYAYSLGSLFLATGNERSVDEYCMWNTHTLGSNLQELLKVYFDRSYVQKGMIVPFRTQTHATTWQNMQKISDQSDEKFLQKFSRESPVQEACVAQSFVPKMPKPFVFPKPNTLKLKNGLTILYLHTPEIDKIDLVIDLKSKHYQDDLGLQGLSACVSNIILEGAAQYDATGFAQKLESYGMDISSVPGSVSLSMLSEDFEHGAELLGLVLTQATCSADSLEQVRERMLSDLANFWDEPNHFSGQLMREIVYRDHPYARNILGQVDDIHKISQKLIKQAYRQKISPDGATMAIVGNLKGHDIELLCEKYFGSWQNSSVTDVIFPAIACPQETLVKRYIDRDQVVISFGAPSVARTDDRYDALLLYDQIFGGGVLGAMSSRLFQLREATGLFYGIRGSLISGAHKQPGMLHVKTMVSTDRVDEAARSIEDLIRQGASTMTQEEFADVQRALGYAVIENFATNKQIAHTFLHAHAFGFAPDFYDHRAEKLASWRRADVQRIVEEFLAQCRLTQLRVGRV
ncbi:MAG: Peptidase M16 domain protein [candidate division TM6 bacterium GW2011_GWE2_41_16]|nr:MAG: Peptidase M16 domain protein [candidate division TM6 bacterium GW2011_GWE2_41_16]